MLALLSSLSAAVAAANDGGNEPKDPAANLPQVSGDDHIDGEDTVDASTDHGDHMGSVPIALPQTEAEIASFVAAVISSPEIHSHEDGSSKAAEHMAAMDLAPRAEATHVAIGHGDWDDPATWHNGEVPGDDARVLIPEGVHITYDHVSDARLFTVRVDGKLEFATQLDSQMVVDTVAISPSGTLQIGTEAAPVAPHVNVDIIFANNGAIDTDWDPMLLSRGMVAHGSVEIHGAVKDSHTKVIQDPMAGDTWIDVGTAPEGWAVGDTLVIAGTRYEGYYWRNSVSPYEGSEDEVRVISEIKGGMIFFDEPLLHNHDAPRGDLKTSVANYTRNVSFETENADAAEVFERGHVMFMHNDDVNVRYAEFNELGRTDKSEPARNVGEFDTIEYYSNVKGRYSFHFHRAGMDDLDRPAIAEGNAVFGSPGWGFVHHDSNAILDNNATYNTFGAGYVAESGNETGAWNDNIAILAQGNSWASAKGGNDPHNFDLGKTGDGFWFQGRMVSATDNVAASVNHGFVYFHRGPLKEEGVIRYHSEISPISDAFAGNGGIMVPDSHPILQFSGNEAFAANSGLEVVKSNPSQGHDIHSVLEDFTAWSVRDGVFLEYTAHYTLKDFDLIGKEATALSPQGGKGTYFGGRTMDIAIVDSTFTNFSSGIDLYKDTSGAFSPEVHDFSIANPTFIDVDRHYDRYDPTLDKIFSRDELLLHTPDLVLDGPLSLKSGNYYDDPTTGRVAITGTKYDGLGEIEFPAAVDTANIWERTVVEILEKDGYYTTSAGENYFMLDLFFSDRLTGDIYYETHPVMLDENVPLGSWIYINAVSNGVRDLGGRDDLTVDAAHLWATLTDGQIVRTEDALAMEAAEQNFLLGDTW